MPILYMFMLCFVCLIWRKSRGERRVCTLHLPFHTWFHWLRNEKRFFTWFHDCLVVYWVLFRFDVVFDIIHGTMWDTEVTLAVTAVRIVFTFLSTGFQKRTFWFPLHFVFTVMATFTASWFGLFGPWRRQRWHFTSTSSQQLQKSEHMWEKPSQTGNSKIDLSKRH